MTAPVVAVIVARGGSVRLPGKALLPFNGTSLVGHKVRQLRACPAVSRVVVGSDSPAILDEAYRHRADVVRRDDYYCDESRCSANEMLRDMAERVGGSPDDVILWAHPTNPLVRPLTYAAAVDAYRRGLEQGYDSLCSVTRVRRHAWAGGRPMNYDPWAPRHAFASELPPIDFQDGAIFIQPRGQMLANSYFFGETPMLFPIDGVEGWDVDTAADIAAARALLPVVGE